MISPASGIHRPSYNGAPAIQTMTDNFVAEFLPGFAICLTLNVCARVARTAQGACIKPNLSWRGRRHLNMSTLFVSMTIMWWMRHFADV